MRKTTIIACAILVIVTTGASPIGAHGFAICGETPLHFAAPVVFL